MKPKRYPYSGRKKQPHIEIANVVAIKNYLRIFKKLLVIVSKVNSR